MMIEAIGGASFDPNQVLKFLSEIQGHVSWHMFLTEKKW